MMTLKKYDLFIDGTFSAPRSGQYLDSINPFTTKAWCQIPRCNQEDVNHAVESAHLAFTNSDWATMHPSQRGQILRKLGDLIQEHADFLAETEVKDNGKLISEMSAQCHYIPQWFYYYAGLADKIEGAVLPIDKADVFNYTRYEPLGVIAAIVPWNSPLLLATWKLAPALAAGNTVVLKPSEYTSASAFELAKLIDKAGFPKGVVNVISGLGSEIGDGLLTHPKIAKIAFTGGTQTGKHILVEAAKSIKPVTLELGGKSPNIVFSDANIDNAVKGVISGIFAATGQTCIAGSRLLVEKKIHDQFVEKVVAFAKTAKMGDPSDFNTQVGPVTTQAQFQKILDYIDIAKTEGAKCVLGGQVANKPECGDGWFIEPTIFTHVKNNMRIAQEEVFGPILSVIPFEDEREAVMLANDVIYGLAAGVWTQDIRRIFRLTEQLKAGTVWVNTYRMLSYLSPFGGYKESGLGRESGQETLKEYLQVKSVWISTSDDVPNPFMMRLK